MDAETTDGGVLLSFGLPWRWCLVALVPVALFFATSVVRARQQGVSSTAHGPAPAALTAQTANGR